MKKILVLPILCLLLYSCSSKSQLAKNITSRPVPLSASLLTGLYENRIPGDNENSLWNDFCFHYPNKTHDITEGNQVFIHQVNDTLINLELYQFGRLLDSFSLKGKSNKHYFSIKEGTNFSTIVVVSSSVDKRTIIGNDVNADLLIAQKGSRRTFMLTDEIDYKDDGIIVGTYRRLADTRPAKTSFQ
ncbi:hypothetical protein [uncultured Nonlabens sp.]|uniref:hypothetical protein n=1 Tax=uncultured Nonlabens sp. TaxID=859306 RepID=UPI0026277A74|nr:hypothetical protein [uncultured Nonlabens sp.]